MEAVKGGAVLGEVNGGAVLRVGQRRRSIGRGGQGKGGNEVMGGICERRAVMGGGRGGIGRGGQRKGGIEGGVSGRAVSGWGGQRRRSIRVGGSAEAQYWEGGVSGGAVFGGNCSCNRGQ